ncbi:MAG: adenylosuccinate lyase, partial [Candidatus Gastranaerophilales bacterium]|nr:adenylosuccinate lyase [Candidatus Gastranaerophilales bacterium]
MIERYSRKKISDIWSRESKFSYYLKVEIAVLEAMYRLGQIDKISLDHIKKTAKFDLARMDEIEKTVQHDVIAFLTSVNENVGEKYSGLIHKGLTSSDVIDTAFALQIKDASDIIIDDLNQVIESFKKLALKTKYVICAGRSHGIGAEIETFGFKILNHLEMFNRAKTRFEFSLNEISTGQISGPVGTYSNINPEIEKIALGLLNLKPAKISTQIIARDIHANYISALAIIACAIENFAVEIRHLQRWEVAEVEEGFGEGQKGSSAMPHKKNPVKSENLTGLARVIRGNLTSAMEDIVLWHERDISHSSVERIIFPDSTILIDFMLARLKNLIDNLVIKEENMKRNADKYGCIMFSQACLLKLVESGKTREAAYEIVQKEALEAFNSNGNFKNNMKKYFSPAEIEECFDYNRYLK